MSLKQEIEVILFWNSKPVTISKIAEVLDCNPTEVKKGLMDLVREYELRDGGLQISVRGHGYLLEPKEEFLNLAQKFVPINLKVGALRTLAIIALKEPVKQREIIEVRGSGAYDHIRDLVEAGWVLREQDGLSYIVKTSLEFKKHFRLSDSGDELKDKLQKILDEASKLQQEQDNEDITSENNLLNHLENLQMTEQDENNSEESSNQPVLS
ncbi:MAG: SMC-Scp complex subunit ScpB [Candidatus Caenarcaniphilales bacterium]|nr:SMC-Scp complex subunit ScpB [Candidatus Caenarcaniphilales bacterium]